MKNKIKSGGKLKRSTMVHVQRLKNPKKLKSKTKFDKSNRPTPEAQAKNINKRTLKRKHFKVEGDEIVEQPPKKKVKKSAQFSEDASKQEMEKQSLKQNHEQTLERTLFVGNIPVDTKMKQIKNLFSCYGHIISIRIRGAIPTDRNMSKKVAAITRKLNPNIKSLHCFVVFASKEAISKALVMNGKELKGHHLRVDSAKSKNDYNPRNAVFIGNLPFDAQEDDVWKAFQECGNILSVRIIRDNATGIGKGFGYVNFDHVDAVELALQLDVNIRMRNIRIKRIGASAKKKSLQGKKIRQRPRAIKNDEENKSGEMGNKKKSKATDFHGAKFKTKKKVKKVTKSELEKRKLSKILTKSK